MCCQGVGVFGMLVVVSCLYCFVIVLLCVFVVCVVCCLLFDVCCGCYSLWVVCFVFVYCVLFVALLYDVRCEM